MRQAQRININGFTLIELLVVIGIITVLVAILIPVLSKAREAARASGCVNNQRQLAMAISMWAQDHDDTYPAADTVWQNLSEPPKLFICPTAGTKQRIGYVYNANLSEMAMGGTTVGGNESRFIVTVDGSTVDHVAYRRRDVDLRHHGKAIASFVDGHVQRVEYSQLSGYHIGNLVFKPVPFTSNSRYTAVITPEGTTITCVGQPDNVWGNHIMSDPISDVPAGSYCRLEFKVATPSYPFGCGFSINPPVLCNGFTDTWPSDNTRIDLYEDPPGQHVKTLNARYNTTDLYALERLPDGTVNYLINDKIVSTSSMKITGALQFHFNGYCIGTEVRNLRYCVE